MTFWLLATLRLPEHRFSLGGLVKCKINLDNGPDSELPGSRCNGLPLLGATVPFILFGWDFDG